MTWYEIILFIVAFIFLIGGIDDLVIDLIRLLLVRKSLPLTYTKEEWEKIQRLPQRPIALLIPAWQESQVLEPMVETNLERIQYQNYKIVIGVYPNDPATLLVARKLEAKHPSVMVVVTDQNGPTSKAHCLNCILGRLESGTEKPHWTVIHDAEDVIDPKSFLLVNFYGQTHPQTEFIQVPVFSLPVVWKKWIAGTYLDEFAELHLKELPAKQQLGMPIPSAGVGTFLTWQTLQKLQTSYGYHFDEANLTEDYELSIRIARLGGQQEFLIARNPQDQVIATREYFPEHFRASIRQKTRWATGITLQSAQKWTLFGVFKWPRGQKLKLIYALFRDRRALWVNPAVLMGWILILLVLFVLPFFPFFSPAIIHKKLLYLLFFINLCFAINRAIHRVWWTSQLYGVWSGVLSFPRIFISILINGIASYYAFFQFRKSKRDGTPKRISWMKTEHRFPTKDEISKSL